MPDVHRRRAARRRRQRATARPDLPELPDDFPATVAATAAAVTAGAPTHVRRHAGAAELVPDAVRVQPRRARRARQQRHRGVPAPARRLLRAVRRHVRGDGPVARHPGPGRRRLHTRPRPGRRHPLRARPQLPRLAGGLVRRPRLGAVRADARARRARRRGAHRACRRARTRPPRHRAPADEGDSDRRRRPPRPRPSRQRSTISNRRSRPATPAAPLGSTRVPIAGPPWGAIGVAVLALGALVAAARARAPLAPPPPVRRRRQADRRPVAAGARRARGHRACASTRRSPPASRPGRPHHACPVAARPLKSLAAVATAATYAPPDEVAELATPHHAGRAGTEPLVPPDRAHRRRLDDHRRPPPPLLHRLAVTVEYVVPDRVRRACPAGSTHSTD